MLLVRVASDWGSVCGKLTQASGLAGVIGVFFLGFDLWWCRVWRPGANNITQMLNRCQHLVANQNKHNMEHFCDTQCSEEYRTLIYKREAMF